MRISLRTLIVLFALIIGAVNLSIAQQKTDAMLFGDVKSARTGDHIPFASIAVKGSSMGTTADFTGHFKLAHLPVGKNIIVVSAVGFKSVEKEVMMEAGKSTEFFVQLESDVLNLEQIVVTATRSEHFVKDVPIRTEIITSKAIQNKNASNIYQALEGTPGIRVENQCQACNFTMVRMQGLGAEHTQVLINGQPMFSGLAGVYGLQQISTIDISQIEVVKGAGSALYGSSAVAGAINIVTKEPDFSPTTTIDLQMGSFQTNKFDISSSIRNEKGNVGLNVFAQRYTEGIIDQTGPGIGRKEVYAPDSVSDRVATNLTNAGFGVFVDDIFSKNDKLIIRGKSIFENRKGGIIHDNYYRNPFTDGTENISTDRYEGELSYNKKFIGSEINFNMAYVNHNRDATNDSYLNDFLDVHEGALPDVRDMRPYLAKENSLASTLSFGKRIKNHSIMMGVQAFFTQLDESGMYVVTDSSSVFHGVSYQSDADKHAREFGFFIQDEWSLGEKWMVVPGVRFDKHQSGEKYTSDRQVFVSEQFPETSFDENSVNPRLAIRYKLNDRFTFRANAGTGYRAPYGFSEDLHLCSGSPRVWKSSTLEPETSMSFNFSADYYGNDFRVSTNVFRTNLKNKIGFTDADADVAAMGYTYQWKNIDDAFVQGVELSLMTELVQDLSLGLDVTYNQGEYKNVREDWVETPYEKDSKYISRFPTTTGNLRLEYSPKKWSFIVTGNYQGQMYIDYYNEDVDPVLGDLSKIKKTAPYMLFNARVARQQGIFRLYAGVNNIFNYVQEERYLDDAAFLYAPVYGTMFYGGVSVRISH